MTERERKLLAALRWALWWIARKGAEPLPDEMDTEHWESWSSANKALRDAAEQLILEGG